MPRLLQVRIVNGRGWAPEDLPAFPSEFLAPDSDVDIEEAVLRYARAVGRWYLARSAEIERAIARRHPGRSLQEVIGNEPLAVVRIIDNETGQRFFTLELDDDGNLRVFETTLQRLPEPDRRALQITLH